MAATDQVGWKAMLQSTSPRKCPWRVHLTSPLRLYEELEISNMKGDPLGIRPQSGCPSLPTSCGAFSKSLPPQHQFPHSSVRGLGLISKVTSHGSKSKGHKSQPSGIPLFGYVQLRQNLSLVSQCMNYEDQVCPSWRPRSHLPHLSSWAPLSCTYLPGSNFPGIPLEPTSCWARCCSLQAFRYSSSRAVWAAFSFRKP